VVDEQLGSPVEQLAKCLLAVVRVEGVVLLHRDPGQLASKLRELVTEPGVLLLAGEQPFASSRPLFLCSDRVLKHCFLPLSFRVRSEEAAKIIGRVDRDGNRGPTESLRDRRVAE
jgi:hypothetical protein